MDEDLVRLREADGVEHPRPEKAVEADDVFPNEVVALRPGILPVVREVLPVLRAPVLERGEVADRGVHPHVEVLVGVAGNLEAEVRRRAGDAPTAQGLVEPFEELVRDVTRRVFGDPRAQIVVLGLQLEVEVFGIPDDGRGAARRADGVAQLLGGVGGTALVAAVAVLALRAALGARALHETVGQEHLAMFTVELRRRALRDAAGLLHRGEELLGERLILGRVRRIVVVKGDLEVREVLQVRGVAAGDQLLGRDALLRRADHDRGAVGVVGTDVDAVVPAHLLKPHPEIGLNVLHQMSQVDVPVGIGQGGCDDNATLL